ncbi:guanylate kinase [Furfurilactobacillus siliginis]|uniref:Guanylate kinase n=1 Tax=Furfurilactobacillus siliginis TaxID=348151 RepID=A0A0R2L3T1_9LACO|nr:guanylate kinase [Furfurilactobacillus siliginis]KRN96363.1 guanylate kinase [Furfurilactobacillus siliginis]GEK29216.1 guanylate kinase [Furfurilactobacillus siliginis]
MKKRVFVITGATGTGKTTVSDYLRDYYHMPKVITHTTRPPRKGEMNGVDYYFEDAASFEQNHYLEEVEYSGYRYGSSHEGLDAGFEKNPYITIVLDTKGAITYAQELGDEAVIVFLTVSEDEALIDRMTKRGDDTLMLQQRVDSPEYRRDLTLPKALQDVAHVIVNDDLETTKVKIDALVSEIIATD